MWCYGLAPRALRNTCASLAQCNSISVGQQMTVRLVLTTRRSEVRSRSRSRGRPWPCGGARLQVAGGAASHVVVRAAGSKGQRRSWTWVAFVSSPPKRIQDEAMRSGALERSEIRRRREPAQPDWTKRRGDYLDATIDGGGRPYEGTVRRGAAVNESHEISPA